MFLQYDRNIHSEQSRRLKLNELNRNPYRGKLKGNNKDYTWLYNPEYGYDRAQSNNLKNKKSLHSDKVIILPRCLRENVLEVNTPVRQVAISVLQRPHYNVKPDSYI